MSFDWLDYLTLAEYMNSKAGEFPDEEACYRSVVSRAYFSVYCLTRNFVKEVDKVTFGSDDHHRLQKHLLEHPHRIRNKIGLQLRELHQYRKKADYQDNLDEMPVNTASKALTKARKIERELAQSYPHN